MSGEVRVRVVRTLSEIEEIRDLWTSWQRHPNVDIDFYLTILRLKPQILQPFVIVGYRDGHPEAVLVGRIVHERVEFKVGYKTVFKPKVRLLNFVYGGALGNISSENSKVMVGEILECLRQGEADMAAFNYIRADSPIYHSATRVPGVLSRDFYPEVQSHWSMTLPGSVEEVYSRVSRDHQKKLRWQVKKLLSDHPDIVRVYCFREVGELERMIHDVEEIAKKTYQRGLGVGFIDNEEMRQRLRLEAAKGWLRAYVLYVADKPCAFWVGYVYQNVFHSGCMGYDPSFERYSPGTFVMRRTIEDLCNTGVRELDFGLGEAWYKQRFSNCNWEEALVYIFAPTLKAYGLNIIRTSIILLEQFTKKTLEHTRLLPRIKRAWRNRVRQSQTVEGGCG